MAAETPSDTHTTQSGEPGESAPAAEPTRRCWRCLQQFPTDAPDEVVRPAEWWVCSACHDALFPR